MKLRSGRIASRVSNSGISLMLWFGVVLCCVGVERTRDSRCEYGGVILQAALLGVAEIFFISIASGNK